MVSADGWGATGREHESQGLPCQDSLAFGVFGDRSIACVSDGCSGAPRSELGSHALARSALALFSEGADFLTLPAEGVLALILDRAQAAARLLGFDLKTAHATLLLVCHDGRSAQARALLWGDGHIGRCRDGRLELLESSSPHNMPFYPAYALDPRGASAWAEAGGSQALIPLGSAEGLAQASPDAREAWIDFAPGDLIFAATDGAARAGGLSPREALGELALIKSRAGRHTGRRMSRARKDWEAAARARGEAFAFEDDFSIAALLRGPDPEAA